MDGEAVEKVVPLGALDEMEGIYLGYARRPEDRELIVSVLLVDETGLPIPSRMFLACSIAPISVAVLWMVDSVTTPRSCSDIARLIVIGGAVPGIFWPCRVLLGTGGGSIGWY